jgi:AcrR family transcriptional regulator
MASGRLDTLPADPVERLSAMPPSMIKILSGALAALPGCGARRLSMRGIGEASGVSRGTLYKYFASREEVLSAIAEYLSLRFEKGVREAAAGIDDPLARLRAVVEYQIGCVSREETDRLLVAEPAFVATFLRAHFPRRAAALRMALAPTFAHFEARLGHALDRQLIAEMLVRLQLSAALIPADERLRQLPAAMATALVLLGGACENEDRGA